MSFYDRVNALCAEKGCSISKMAEDIGISKSLNRWRSDGVMPRSSTLKSIADYFGITMQDLLSDAVTNIQIGNDNVNHVAFAGDESTASCDESRQDIVLTRQEQDLIKLYRELSVLNQSRLIVYAYDLKKEG